MYQRSHSHTVSDQSFKKNWCEKHWTDLVHPENDDIFLSRSE